MYGSLAATAVVLVCTILLTGYIDRYGAAWFSQAAHWSPKSHDEAIGAAAMKMKAAAGSPVSRQDFDTLSERASAPSPVGSPGTATALADFDEYSDVTGSSSASKTRFGGTWIVPAPTAAKQTEDPWEAGRAGSHDRLSAVGYGGDDAGPGAMNFLLQENGDGIPDDARLIPAPNSGSLKNREYTKNLPAHFGYPPHGVQAPWIEPSSIAESYEPIVENAFVQVLQGPLSTFGLDVDTASYANTRRFLNSGQLPPRDAVRVEEFVNAFRYEYAGPTDGHPIAVHADIAGCPWNSEHRLARVAVKAKEVPFDAQPPVRLTFLIDVSGSMQDANKLPLLRESMKALVRKLRPTDQVAICTYRDTAQCVLLPTPCAADLTILSMINLLHADGSTNGAGGIEVAYATAREQFVEGGLNRVILATDGDFNVGETENTELTRRIEEHAKSGVFLTVLGFGVDNLKDDRLEGLADKGNGNYHYIDSFAEANKVLVERMAGTIAVAAKDAKIQVEFNPAKVSAYRLLGYENRALAAQDFNDDRKDAGDLGAGHTVTALYELVPVGVPVGGPGVDALKYQPAPAPQASGSPETLTVKVRYKAPNAGQSTRIDVPVTDAGVQFEGASTDFRFATAVAAFAMLLRDSHYVGSASLDTVHAIADATANAIPERTEFISLVVAAKSLRAGQ
ncbi:MAG: VWA domain-containing protein [Candidatus Hydrogenedentes bacterium]|nr:VWA domain-containing protein [Candidatus Hydrogenedentota bacterium]